jgi:hypothetical protein
MTTTARLERLSNAAASAIARGQRDLAQAATVGMRHILEAHRVPSKRTWWELHDHYAEQCGA